jgi:hypothetical protein
MEETFEMEVFDGYSNKYYLCDISIHVGRKNGGVNNNNFYYELTLSAEENNLFFGYRIVLNQFNYKSMGIEERLNYPFDSFSEFFVKIKRNDNQIQTFCDKYCFQLLVNPDIPNCLLKILKKSNNDMKKDKHQVLLELKLNKVLKENLLESLTRRMKTLESECKCDRSFLLSILNVVKERNPSLLLLLPNTKSLVEDYYDLQNFKNVKLPNSVDVTCEEDQRVPFIYWFKSFFVDYKNSEKKIELRVYADKERRGGVGGDLHFRTSFPPSLFRIRILFEEKYYDSEIISDSYEEIWYLIGKDPVDKLFHVEMKDENVLLLRDNNFQITLKSINENQLLTLLANKIEFLRVKIFFSFRRKLKKLVRGKMIYF